MYVTDSFAGKLYRFDHDGNGKLTRHAPAAYKVTLDSRVKSLDELKASVSSRIKSTGPTTSPLERKDAEHRAIRSVTADIKSISRGPDGAFYVVGSSGLARFEGKGAVLTPSPKAAATWVERSTPKEATAVTGSTKRTEGPPNSPLWITIIARDD